MARVNFTSRSEALIIFAKIFLKSEGMDWNIPFDEDYAESLLGEVDTEKAREIGRKMKEYRSEMHLKKIGKDISRSKGDYTTKVFYTFWQKLNDGLTEIFVSSRTYRLFKHYLQEPDSKLKIAGNKAAPNNELSNGIRIAYFLFYTPQLGERPNLDLYGSLELKKPDIAILSYQLGNTINILLGKFESYNNNIKAVFQDNKLDNSYINVSTFDSHKDGVNQNGYFFDYNHNIHDKIFFMKSSCNRGSAMALMYFIKIAGMNRIIRGLQNSNLTPPFSLNSTTSPALRIIFQEDSQ